MKCLECGNDLTRKTQKRFCSQTCANRSRARKRILWATYNCGRCGKEVVTKPRYIGKYLFCKDCRTIYHTNILIKSVRDRNNPPITLICSQCKREFTILACYNKGRKYCSRECFYLARIGKPSHHKPVKHSSGIGCWREDLQGYYRSRWEANYARYLNYIKRPYKFEPDRFLILLKDNSQHSYCPDFLIEDSYYIEVKAFFRREHDKEIFESAQQQLPKPLYLLMPDQYKSIEQKYASKIKHWEYKGDPPPAKSKRLCPICGKLVRSIHRKTVFCSRQCSNIRYRKVR